MSGEPTRMLPTEIELAVEVMPCQAMRAEYSRADEEHPCTYFRSWGVYHSFEGVDSGAPSRPAIRLPVVYAGKTRLVPEILAGCRKAPIMAVGINPNLPGYWKATHNALNPLFADVTQYAHYFRYRATAKLAVPESDYRKLLRGRRDGPTERAPLTEPGKTIRTELAEQAMYRAYQSLLDGLAKAMGWAEHRLCVGEDLSYGNMVACPSAKWLSRQDPKSPEMPAMTPEQMRGIVQECFVDRKYFLRQLFQSLPTVLLVFSETTRDAFLSAMQGHFEEGNPLAGESLANLAKRRIVLAYGKTGDTDLRARVLFIPHASANPAAFAAVRARVVRALTEEARAGNLTLNPATGHLTRPVGACSFCTNALYRIGQCNYAAELVPLAGSVPQAFAEEEESEAGTLAEKAVQQRLLEAFLRGPRQPTESEEVTAFAAKAVRARQHERPPFVLQGRIVTMTGPILDRGRLCIRAGRIDHVLPHDAPIPAVFREAPVISTGGTIFPGLLDLHNHVPYNVAQLWDVPKRYRNRMAWQRAPSYRTAVPIPLGVLAGHGPTARAIVRYVEVKALLGGTTSIQGIRSRFRGVESLLHGIVRSFEAPEAPDLPAAGGSVLNLNAADAEKRATFRRGLTGHPAYFYHLSEGVDEASRQFYLDLRRHRLLRPSLIAIHALALRKEDLTHLAGQGCKVVWSPLSNLLLYGRTVNPKILADSGVPFSIGSDWSPTGSKNLLLELKVARHLCNTVGAPFSDRGLCESVTRVAADSVGWSEHVGTIAPGKYADLLVLRGEVPDPYAQLIRATEADVAMVVVDGKPRCGDAKLMRAAVEYDELELLDLGAQTKALHLYRADSPLAGLTFTGARRTLARAMKDLRAIETDTATAFAAGDDFSLVLDNEADTLIDAQAPLPLPASIPLDEPTVVSEAKNYFRRLGKQRNIAKSRQARGLVRALAKYYSEGT